MGMFDWVVGLTIKCPNCGKDVTDFQTKDTECTLSRVSYEKVDNFHTSCDACGQWIEVHREVQEVCLMVNGRIIRVKDGKEIT